MRKNTFILSFIFPYVNTFPSSVFPGGFELLSCVLSFQPEGLPLLFF
jgi:hypothetical protein